MIAAPGQEKSVKSLSEPNPAGITENIWDREEVGVKVKRWRKKQGAIQSAPLIIHQ